MSAVYFKGKAAKAGLTKTLSPQMIKNSASVIGVDHAKLTAVVDVEALGEGYLDDGRIIILFEAHKFGKFTKGKFNASHPNISSKRWNRKLYWGGKAEYVRLENAMELDQTAALKSASYGFGQVMGFNHELAGFDTPQEMVRAFADSPQAQLDGMATFCQSRGLVRHLQACDFTSFACGYNGRSFAIHGYHFRIGTAWAARSGLDGLHMGDAGQEIRHLQRAIALSGHDVGKVDGAWGPKSATGLLAYQKATRMPYPGFLS